MRPKKLIALILGVCVALSIVIPVHAANPPGKAKVKEEGKQIVVPIKLTADAVVFDVTVPTVLPMHLNLDGSVTTPTGLDIVNNSTGPVKTAKLEIATVNGWSFEPYDADFTTMPVDTKKVAIQLVNDGKVVSARQTANLMSFDPFVVIGGHKENTESNVVTLGVNAKATAVSKAIGNTGIDIANIIIVLTWDK